MNDRAVTCWRKVNDLAYRRCVLIAGHNRPAATRAPACGPRAAASGGGLDRCGLPSMLSSVGPASCPIQSGTAVSWLPRRRSLVRLISCAIESGIAVSWSPKRLAALATRDARARGTYDAVGVTVIVVLSADDH